MVPSRLRALSPPLLGLGFLVAVAALLLRLTVWKPLQPLWTVEELARYNGTDEKLPLLLGILGSVFDVTKGRSHYGPGGGYHHFAGSSLSSLTSISCEENRQSRSMSRMVPSRLRAPSPPLLGLGFLVAVAALLRLTVWKPLQPLWTVEELARYNGTDEKLPILLGILGSVFDVTKGRSHYGPGGGYHHFAGRDASRAFVSGNFTGDGLTDSLYGLSSVEVNSVVDWRKFYFERYKYAGKVIGRYYDGQGSPTKHLKGIETKAKRGAQLLQKQKEEEAKIPSCNSKWSEQEGGEVWCDNGYPRLVKRPQDIAATGKISQRCACFKEEELARQGLEVYKGCDYLSKACIV